MARDGPIVGELFDTGYSRMPAWASRPQADDQHHAMRQSLPGFMLAAEVGAKHPHQTIGAYEALRLCPHAEDL